MSIYAGAHCLIQSTENGIEQISVQVVDEDGIIHGFLGLSNKDFTCMCTPTDLTIGSDNRIVINGIGTIFPHANVQNKTPVEVEFTAYNTTSVRFDVYEPNTNKLVFLSTGYAEVFRGSVIHGEF